ncbi:DUF2857 domain-containing protein [Pseudomonas protegens]|uniref:DUF2857 domain-containing protein n=1 Tax=Pseudomonas protegens TaxID=380021 RepID=A0A2T6GB47_9PSED|nr:DUF2857 domain-containing protein [Pseudomonas protegens]PUA41373.1 DUF2857 domain-containing protein [Pseudomonas protegens]
MPKSLINEAILSQILHHLRHGQLRRCVEMGLEPEILAQLQSPAVHSLLLNSQVSWCNVFIDGASIKRLLANAQRSRDEMRTIERALRLGATCQMLQFFFGMSPQDVALQRAMLGLRPRRGRCRALSEELDALVWYRWLHFMREYQVEPEDNVALLDLAMLMTEEINAPPELDGNDPDTPGILSLSVIWNRIQYWIQAGFYPPKGNGRALPPPPPAPDLATLDEGEYAP